MKGTRPGRGPRPSRISHQDRVCKQPGCSTRLSIYNPKPVCWQHADIVFPNYRGRRLTSEPAAGLS